MLRDNDLSLLLMIDGLDELTQIERAKLTGWFRWGAELAGLRDSDSPADRRTSRPRRSVDEGWLVLEVAALDHQAINTLTTLLFEEASEAGQFGKMLAEIQWDRQGPTPLQIVAAASLSKSEVQWRRAVDLPFHLADHLLSLGIAEDAQQRKRTHRTRAAADAVYFDNITAILEHLGQLSLDRLVNEEQILQSLGSLSAAWASDPEGLLRFLRTEGILLGGLIAWLPEIDSEVLGMHWPHRTVAEALPPVPSRNE